LTSISLFASAYTPHSFCEIIKNCPNLQHLDLSKTKVRSDLFANSFIKKEHQADNEDDHENNDEEGVNKIKEKKNAFFPLPPLITLDLSNTDVDDDICYGIARLNQLEELYLSGTRLTGN